MRKRSTQGVGRAMWRVGRGARLRRPLTAAGCAQCRQATLVPRRRRDEEFELATLEWAAMVVPSPVTGSPFVGQAQARLKLGERTYGDRWTRQPAAALLNEVLEEAADVGCWSLLALQALDALTGDEREVVESCLMDAVRAGARAHHAVLRALEAVPPVGRVRGAA